MIIFFMMRMIVITIVIYIYIHISCQVLRFLLVIAIAFRFHSVQRSRAAAIKSFPLTVGRTSAITWGVIWSTQSPNIIKYHQASPSLTIVGGCRWYIYKHHHHCRWYKHHKPSPVVMDGHGRSCFMAKVSHRIQPGRDPGSPGSPAFMVVSSVRKQHWPAWRWTRRPRRHVSGTCQARVSNLELHTCDHTLAWFYTGFIRILMMFYGVPEFPQQKDQSQYLINFPKHRLFQRLEKGLGLSSIGLQLLVMETGWIWIHMVHPWYSMIILVT